MALSLDKKLTAGAMPADAPLDMPVQDLSSWQGSPAAVGNGRDVALARIFVFVTSAALTAFGTWKMYEVINPVNVTALQVLFAGFFAETRALPWDLNGELYFYYLNEVPGYVYEDFDQSRLGRRRLFTPGFRMFWPARKGEWDFEVESAAQTGASREDPWSKQISHEAFLQHLQVGYTFDLPWQPRLIAQYDYASGGMNGAVPRPIRSIPSMARDASSTVQPVSGAPSIATISMRRERGSC
jgi:hypothetical protein